MEKISQKEFHSIKRLSKNYIGLTAEKTINVVSCNTGKEVFVSDKLSNMSQSIYNQETKKLLVYNTSGYAYLYQLPDGKRLLQNIFKTVRYMVRADYMGRGFLLVSIF